MPRHWRGGATKIWACPAPTLRADCGRSLCLSSSPMSLHRLLLSSRPRFASPIRKRYRIYEREYEGTVKTGIQVIRGCSDPIQRAGILHRLSSRSGVGASRWLATSGSPRVARRDRQDCKDLRNVPGTSGADRPADEACGSGRVAGNRNNHLGVNNTAPSRARIQAVSHIRKATGKKYENSS